MKLPEIGTCGQFIRTTREHPPQNILTTCLITGYDPAIKDARGKSIGLVITYRHQEGRLIEDARVTAHDLVSDEDAATHDFPA